MNDLLQYAISGLMTGGVIALLSTGLALIFGVMGVVNFAHGDAVMVAMYTALLISTGTAIPGIAIAVLLLPVFMAVGWLLHLVLIGRLAQSVDGRPAERDHDAQLLLTLGLSLILQNAALMIFGSDPRGGGGVQEPIKVAGLVLDPQRLLAFAIALLVSGALFVVLNRTAFGRGLRAAASDPVAAQYCGIEVKRAHRAAFAIGTGLAGVGGALLATFYPIQPFVSLDFIILMFAAVVLGGLGSVPGACVGGLLIGLIQGLGQIFLPLQLQTLTGFLVFLLILFVRPQGIFGKAVRV
ncbi:branched-chain amino acid ABC transporter permease [Actinomadura sp. SCN-SB]|uniref:branched-chain amino acid ABC transporter permease n=1 Tax=Actinomadura sp. SCN-SB TaxID=3373092 RepID=UPI0037523E4E